MSTPIFYLSRTIRSGTTSQPIKISDQDFLTSFPNYFDLKKADNAGSGGSGVAGGAC